MKLLKYILYGLISIVFLYILVNLNTSITSLSYVLMNFFKSLFPYLFMFLIINQLLIKTGLIDLIGYLLQLITYPLFKVNAKSASLLMISLINGFPSSVLYSYLMVKEGKIDKDKTHKIANFFFLPSLTFIFFLIKNNLSMKYFIFLVLSVYLPCFFMLLIQRNTKNDSYIEFSDIKKELKERFDKFNYIDDLKNIFLNSILTLINILGMISFYSIMTLIIKYDLIKGLLEFSIPSLNILNSNISELLKTLYLIIILVFSSFSSISQASVYLQDINLDIKTFIKTRIFLLSLSLIIFNLCLFLYL